MNFNEEQTERLHNIFKQNDTDGNGMLYEPELRKLLSEFEIDEGFAPALMKIFVGSKQGQGVTFDDLTKFFEVLISGNIKNFFEMLFNAMDGNSDGGIEIEDLLSFSALVGDALTSEDAAEIIKQCDDNKDGKVQFKEFWKWYNDQHNKQD